MQTDSIPGRRRLAFAHAAIRQGVAAGCVLVGTVSCTHPGPAHPSATSPPPGVAAPTAASTTAPARPACTGGDVDVAAASTLSDSTHRGVRLQFTLAHDDAPGCVLTGYPGVYTSAGGPPQVHADDTPRGYLGGLPPGSDDPPPVLLGADRPAQAIVESDAVDAAGSPCPTYSGLVVNPPHTTAIVLMATEVQGCRFEVHPVTDVEAAGDSTHP